MIFGSGGPESFGCFASFLSSDPHPAEQLSNPTRQNTANTRFMISP